MPASTLAARRGGFDAATLRRRAQVFRLAFGMMLSAGVAFGLAWPLSFIAPVITAKLLTLPKVLPVKAGVAFLVLMALAMFIGATLVTPLLAYPFVHMLFTGLAIFLLFYAKASGVNPLLVVLILLGVVLVPVIGSVARVLADAIAGGLVFGIAVAMVLMYTAAAIFPDPPQEEAVSGEAPAKEDAPELPSVRYRAGIAFRSFLVLFPLVLVFQLFSLINAAVALIMAMLLSLEPAFGKHWEAGKVLILSNLSAGLVAVVVYQLMVMVPSFPFLLLIMTLAGLWCGSLIFSDSPLGKLLAAGITAFFVVLGPVLSGEAEAGETLWLRLVLIMAAVLYVVIAFGILERLTRGRRAEA